MASPVYQLIAQELRERIESGKLLPGDQLPTELELRDRYGTSRNTVRDAIKRLTSEGLVETRPGQGTFVIRKVDPFVTVLTGDSRSGGGGDEGAAYLSEVSKTHRRPSRTTPKVEIQVPSAEVSRRLRVPPHTQVVSRHEDRYIDGIPWSLQTSFYPMDFITKGATRLLMAEDIAEGTVRYLAETIAVEQTGYRDWITARVPKMTEQSFFGLAHDATVFEVFRTGFDQTGTPLRVTVTVWPADRSQFIVNVGEDLPAPQYGSDDSVDGDLSEAWLRDRQARPRLLRLPADAVPLGEEPRAAAGTAGRPAGERPGHVLLADSEGDREEDAEQDAEGDAR
jgi:GntR family transcriptional regulator